MNKKSPTKLTESELESIAGGNTIVGILTGLLTNAISDALKEDGPFTKCGKSGGIPTMFGCFKRPA